MNAVVTSLRGPALRPTLAMIVPHWGDSSILGPTLKAFAQSSESAELLLVVCNDRRHCQAVDRVVQGSEISSKARTIVLHAERNVGYSGAANLAIDWIVRQCLSIDLYWILNNDARPDPQSLRALREAAATAPRETAVISCCVLNPDGAPADHADYRPWLGRFRPLTEGATGQGINGVSGASFVLTKNFLNCARRLPGHLFLYFEEVWIAYSARRCGMAVYACSKAIVRHCPNSSLNQLRLGAEIREYLDSRSRLVLAIEWHPLCLLTVVPLTLLRALIEGMAGRIGLARAIIRAVGDGLRLRLPFVPALDNQPLGTSDTIFAIRRGPSRRPAGRRCLSGSDLP